MELNKDIVGLGWSFPPTFRSGDGSVLITGGEEDINNSLNILLNTAFGERVILSRYGCNLRKFLFEPANTNMQAYVKKIVEEAILYYEPRITANKISLTVTDGLLEIDIDYFIKSTNSRSNYVFPFYLTEASLQ